jgi:long-chain fatty acid transport protein
MRKPSLAAFMLVPMCIASNAFASDFSLPFVNTSGLGVMYADWATAANDASTAYTNPAGLVKIPYQQLVFNGIGIVGSGRFNGTAHTPPFPFPGQVVESGAATTRVDVFLPSFYYSLPVSHRYTFGFAVAPPFGMGSTYGKDSLVRYLSTRSYLAGIDMGPDLGIKINDAFSVGLGLDAVRFAFTLSNMYGPPLAMPDAELHNHLVGWGYGWHAGVLYDFKATTRVGFSYNSMVMVHTTGDTEVYPSIPPGTELRYNSQKTNFGLPARAQLSLQHDFTQRIAGMATIFYTNWVTFSQVTMKKTMTPFGSLTSVTIPFNYHNTLDYSVGGTYKATDKWLLRAGLEYLNTPSNNRDRGVADPIGTGTVVAVGAHYQQSARVGYDVGLGHAFFNQMAVNNVNPVTSLSGHNNSQTTIFGGQINWNLC